MISTAFSFKLSTILRLKKFGFWHCSKPSLVSTCLSICVCGWHACGVIVVVCCMLVICIEGSLAKSALIQTCTHMPCISICATTAVMPAQSRCFPVAVASPYAARMLVHTGLTGSETAVAATVQKHLLPLGLLCMPLPSSDWPAAYAPWYPDSPYMLSCDLQSTSQAQGYNGVTTSE